jgi:hypothetical protein
MQRGVIKRMVKNGSLLYLGGALTSFIGQIIVWLVANKISFILLFLFIINSILTIYFYFQKLIKFFFQSYISLIITFFFSNFFKLQTIQAGAFQSYISLIITKI